MNSHVASHALVSPGERPQTDGSTLELLGRVAADIAVQPSLWRSAVRFDGTERCRTRIDTPDGLDAWVMTWLTFQGTRLHDHTEAASVFTVVEGALHEVRPDPRGRLLPRKYVPGVVGLVEPGVVHDVRNELAAPAISIHVYAPRLVTTRYWTWEAGRIAPSSLEHDA